MQQEQSRLIFSRAKQLMPGGVNSPARAFKSIGGQPPVFEKARGAEMVDVDGNLYIDFCASWGVFMAGHAHPKVEEEVIKRVSKGTSFGAPTLEENLLAEQVIGMVPSIDMVRFVNSGTEAVMSALRLARAFTGRDYVLKFEGCYHGHADYLLASAGSAVAETSKGQSPGVPYEYIKYTITLPFNRPDLMEKVFRELGQQIAAVIVEPLPANMGVVLPEDGFLHFLRDITHNYGSLLVFDEVITGFRLSAGGAQQYWDIAPDITTLGKIVGGGFPCGAFGASKKIMELLAPVGDVYQAGTLSGNPVAMVAGYETLKILNEPGFYSALQLKANTFYSQLKDIINPYPLSLAFEGSMFTLFFRSELPKAFHEVQQCDMQKFAAFYKELLESGVYISPSPFEASFVTGAHTTGQLEKTIEAIRSSLQKVY